MLQLSAALCWRLLLLPLLLLPVQFRNHWLHLDAPGLLTAPTIEAFYFAAVRATPEGAPAEPLLSLFTPAYKSGAKIQIPYESLLAQSYQNWEWVIYDDSPPEHTETWEALSALRDKDPRIVPIRTDRNDAFIGSVKVCVGSKCVRGSTSVCVWVFVCVSFSPTHPTTPFPHP